MNASRFGLAAGGGIIAVILSAALTPVGAGPEKVQFPANYRANFVVYNEIERPDRKPAQIRVMYASRAAIDAARANTAAPQGAVLIMEDRIAQVDAAGNPVRDANGRLIATDQVANLFVMEKQAGWGAEYPATKRNGEWEYSQFTLDGAMRQGLNTDGCFACHMSRAGRDFTFTFVKWVNDGKPAK